MSKEKNTNKEAFKSIDDKIKEYEKKLKESTSDLAVAYNKSKLEYFKGIKEFLMNS